MVLSFEDVAAAQKRDGPMLGTTALLDRYSAV